MPGRYFVIIAACASTALATPRKPPKRHEPRDVLEAHVVYTLKQPGGGDCPGVDGVQRVELVGVGNGDLQVVSMGAGGEGDQLMFMADRSRVSFKTHDGIGPTTQEGTGEVSSPPGVAEISLNLVNHNGLFVPLSDEGGAGLISANGQNVQTTWWGPGKCNVQRRAAVEQGMFASFMYDGSEDPKGWRSHKPKLVLDAGAIGKAIASGKPAVITATAHYHWGNADHIEDADVTITLRIRPPKIEAHLVADDKLDTWIPEGPTPKKKEGNTFAAHLELFDPDTGKAPDNVKVKKATYTLESSSVPGVCGNWPIDRSPIEDSDLFFDKPKNPKGKMLDANQLKMELGAKDWNTGVVVSSRDWGAYGQLKAALELDDGTTIDASADGNAGIPLPLDKDNNHIADAWQPGRGKASDDDDEQTGVSTPAVGDGYTAYEEYRGLLVSKGGHRIPAADEEFTRLDPTKIDYLVVIEDPDGTEEAAIKKGVATFARLLGINTWFIGNINRLVNKTSSKRPRNALPNSTRDNGAVAIWITTIPPDRVPPGDVATAMPIRSCGDEDETLKACMHDPSKIAYVQVTPRNAIDRALSFPMNMFDPDVKITGPKSAAVRTRYEAIWNQAGLDASKRRALIAAFKKQLATKSEDVIAFSVMHELGHTVGMFHHDEFEKKYDHSEGGDEYDATGARDCPMRYWQIADPHDENAMIWAGLFRGWNVAEGGPDGGPWQFCAPNRAQVSFTP